MADIVVTTDFSQVNNLNNSLKATDGLFVKVVDSILREEARARRITKKFAKTTEENLAIIAQAEAIVAEKMQIAADKREKARQREAARAEKEAARIAAAIKKQADAEARLAEEVAKNRAISAQRSTAALNQRLGVTGSPATASGAGFSAMEAEVERLRLKYDQIYASSQLYESSLNELNRVHMLGITSTKQHEAAVESLNAEYQAFQNGAARVGNRFAEYNSIMQQSQRGLARYGVVMQQTGYQVGDFLVQVQSGTNAFVAFGQQATQLAGLLTMSMNPKLVAAGAALSILIPLATAFGAAWMRTSEKVKDGAKDQEDAIKALDQTLKQYLRTKEAAASGLTPDQKTAIEELNEAQKESIAANQRLTELGYFQNQNSKALLGNSAAAVGTAIALVFQSGKVADALERQAKAQEDVNTLRNKMLETYEEESRRLAESTRLEEARIRFGEDSFTYKQLLAEEDRKAYERSLQTLDISEGYVRALMAQYDAAVRNRKEVEDTRDKAKSLMDLLERFHGSEFQAILKVKADVPDFMEDIRNKLEAIEGGFDPNNIPRPRRAPNDIDAALPPEVKNKGKGREQEDPLKKLREQLTLENELLGVSEAQERVLRALGDDRSKYSEAEINAITAEVEAYNQKLEVLKQQQQLADTVKSSMEDAFMSMVDGTSSVKDAFKSMAAEIIKELYRVFVVQRMVNSLMGFFSPATATTTSFGTPNFFGGGRASGGSIMPNRPYLVGEHGPELVIPRHSGTVVNANQTAGAMSGGGDITVQNNITVTGSDAAMVRAEVAKMIPQITNATKAAVIDAKQRGGQMSAAFR